MKLSEAVDVVEAIIQELEVEIEHGARADITGQIKTVREAWDTIKQRVQEVSRQS